MDYTMVEHLVVELPAVVDMVMVNNIADPAVVVAADCMPIEPESVGVGMMELERGCIVVVVAVVDMMVERFAEEHMGYMLVEVATLAVVDMSEPAFDHIVVVVLQFDFAF
jgi:hypothetical protein